ncbi:MAG: GNAT family N-acetyltransferase [Myxococcales bacterium]|nr:GNAT family N-acetyltransferase [Myxococcales bacterium]
MRVATERLVLREFVEDDWRTVYAIESQPEVVRYQTNDVYDEAAAREYVQGILVSAREVPRLVFDFAITLDGVMIGRTGMKRGDDPRMASLWFEVMPELQGKGYATEAARALLGYAFEEVKLHRVYGDCDPRNPSSARVMEKVGMRREAHLVQNVFIKGEWCDSLMFAMLASEWRR